VSTEAVERSSREGRDEIDDLGPVNDAEVMELDSIESELCCLIIPTLLDRALIWRSIVGEGDCRTEGDESGYRSS